MARLKIPQQRAFFGPAKLWKRAAAFFIDFLVLEFIVFWPFRSLFGKMIPESSINSIEQLITSSSQAGNALIAASVAMGVITILYFAMLEYKMGQTIGKMLMNLHVVSELKAREGRSRAGLAFWQCIVRSVLWLPMFPFLLFWIIDPIYALFNQKRQRLFELMSFTSTLEVYQYNPYPSYYNTG